MYMEAYSAVTYLGVHVLVDLCPVEHGSIVLVDVDSSQPPCTYKHMDKYMYYLHSYHFVSLNYS